MSSYSKIVVGTDGSDAAHGAIVVTGVVGARLEVPVTAVTAWRAHVEVPGARELDWAERTTMAADVELTATGVKEVCRVEVKGDPADSLMQVAGEEPETLIVVGARGLDKAPRRILGSASNDLSHKSIYDVLFVRRPVSAIDTVALATDGSDTAMIAVRHGYELAARLGAQISLVTVAESIDAGQGLLRKVEQQLLQTNPEAYVELRVITGSPADGLSRDAAKYDLVVIGNRGMSGLARVLGSTANTVTHHAGTNLLLVNTTRG